MVNAPGHREVLKPGPEVSFFKFFHGALGKFYELSGWLFLLLVGTFTRAFAS